MYYETQEEAILDIQLYLEHYGEDYPQLYKMESEFNEGDIDGAYFRELVQVKVTYNAPWPVEVS